MSLNRENVIWQSKDGTWNRGFYDYYEPVNQSGDDWDNEWDVEYKNEFRWVSTGHPTQDAAWRSWTGVNPGGHTSISYSRRTAKECAELDELVWRFNNPQAAQKKDARALRAKVRKVVRDENMAEGSWVKITCFPAGYSANVEQWFTGQVHEGILSRDGDWLVLSDQNHSHKVYNVKTGAVHSQITGIAKSQPVMRRYYGW